MKKLFLIVALAVTISQARADELYMATSVGVIGPGLQFGWESDQNFGVRVAVGALWGAGIFAGADVYGQWKVDSTRWYFGAGVTTVVAFAANSFPTKTYVAPELLIGLASEVAPKFELFFEWNPGLAIYQNPAAGFEDFPIIPIGLFSRFQLGFRYRF
ncbi:MAG: hypothetical protein HC933_04295 [Pleurocapsa sp. SU_196_0]|nr:hypothetical protein [Pleurocapsa sp. SU_196_0]